jgi:CO dehydrogenase maturation factor
MKIAVLGKGGTGKSSISWLLSKYLSRDKGHHTLAIDGDHNMDLTSCLKANTDNINYFKDFNDEFRKLANLPKIGMWREYFNVEPVSFIYPNDSKLEKYINKIDSNLDLLVLGLGDDNIMYGNKCSHGLSAPLKYMLPNLELQNNSWIVLDSVAGSDMLNYGLYFSFDCLIIVVEGHINSIKVAKQLKQITDKQGLEIKFLLNKYNPENLLTKEFEEEFRDNIIGNVPIDTAIMDYNYEKVGDTTKQKLSEITNKIQNTLKNNNSYELLKSFEQSKM